MVEGGPIDVLTGDWLAELTMLILSRIRAKRPGGGFASHVRRRRWKQVMGTCLDKRHQGRLERRRPRPGRLCRVPSRRSPTGWASTRRSPTSTATTCCPGIEELGRAPVRLEAVRRRRHVRRRHPRRPRARYLTANAYLRMLGASSTHSTQGADIVITGRVTDAAVTCGPAAWHHGWAARRLRTNSQAGSSPVT